MRVRWLAAGSAAVLLLAACNNAEPTPNPELAFCDSLEVLAQSVAAFDKLDAQSTVDDVQAGMEAVEEAAGNVRDAAGDLADSQVEAIQTAADELRDYRETLDGSETVEQVVAGFADQVVALKAARLEAGQAHCGLAEAQAAASQAAEALASLAPEPAASPEAS